jgi:hypothetical protein
VSSSAKWADAIIALPEAGEPSQESLGLEKSTQVGETGQQRAGQFAAGSRSILCECWFAKPYLTKIGMSNEVSTSAFQVV